MDGWMDGWMGGWVDGWMGGWVDGWMGGWVDGWMGGWLDFFKVLSGPILQAFVPSSKGLSSPLELDGRYELILVERGTKGDFQRILKWGLWSLKGLEVREKRGFGECLTGFQEEKGLALSGA